MLSVSDEIRDCYKQAEACARQAAAQSDPKLRQDFLPLETAWLKLAKLRERDLPDQVRQRAYEMWIANGCTGEAEQHWLTAEREILFALQSTNSSAEFRPTETREAEAEILEELRQSLSHRKSGGT
jgi:Protein of unknown function (DUF2934)